MLVLLFVKYVSDKWAGQADVPIETPEGGSFTDMLALKGDKEIGDKMNKIIARLVETNDLKGEEMRGRFRYDFATVPVTQ